MGFLGTGLTVGTDNSMSLAHTPQCQLLAMNHQMIGIFGDLKKEHTMSSATFNIDNSPS